MTECAYLPTCPFFAETLPEMPAMAHYLKSAYCQREPEKCARYLVREAVGKEHVPQNLFPDEGGQATQIIAALTNLTHAG